LSDLAQATAAELPLVLVPDGETLRSPSTLGLADALGLRTRAQQEALWAGRAAHPYPVAPPGSSQHERGLAVDVSEPDALVVESLRIGLCRPYANDPVHLELC